MTDIYASRANYWADSVYSSVGCVAPPVDLHAVARFRRVKRVGLRLMVNRGVLIPVPGGFDLFLRDLDSQDLDIEKQEPPCLLSPRQRFTFAHEIAHTFFYKSSNGVPSPTGVVKNLRELENICDRAAARLLVPTNLLKREIRQELGDCKRIDAAFVRVVSSKFCASYEVMIDRLRGVEPSNVFSRCIVLVRESDGEALVRASYLGLGLISTLTKPKLYEPVVNWFPGFPRQIADHNGKGKWEVPVGGRNLVLEKIPLGAGDFLLQVDAPDR